MSWSGSTHDQWDAVETPRGLKDRARCRAFLLRGETLKLSSPELRFDQLTTGENLAAPIECVIAYSRARDEVLQRAIWLLEERDGPTQGIAFAAEGLDLVTA